MARVQMTAIQKIGSIAAGETFTASSPTARTLEAIGKATRSDAVRAKRVSTAAETGLAAKKATAKRAAKKATYRTRDMKAD